MRYTVHKKNMSCVKVFIRSQISVFFFKHFLGRLLSVMSTFIFRIRGACHRTINTVGEWEVDKDN